jgi:L-serine/L-threonine ammonia-lyase
MKPLHIETPLFESRALSTALSTAPSTSHANHADRRVWLKLEAMQAPGSFKIRGIGAACIEYQRRGASRFISSSGGNAGIAVAYAGRHLSVPVVVVVPETATERAKSLILQEGAELIVHGASWNEAHLLALSMLKETDAFLHPFDDPLIWRGHATMLDEVKRSGVVPDAVVLSVGGGGLLCGVVEGLRRNGWEDIPVIAVETQGAASFAQSIWQGARIELPAITSIATSLGAKQVCEQAFALSQQHPIHPVLVSDSDAVSACQNFIRDHRVVVEPACGAALAAVYGDVPILQQFKSILVIVCGGVTASVEQLQHWSTAMHMANTP